MVSSSGEAKVETAPQWKSLAMDNKPTWVLSTPFLSNEHSFIPALTVFELTMYELSWALRSKPEWQRKAANPEIRRKWRQEALQQGSVRLTDKMIDYVLTELDGYAKIADNERGIERACFDAIWYSDRLVPNDVLERLKSAAKELEDVPEDKKDWHPRSNKQVLDLVHPSLYCVVYGRTHAYLPGEPQITENFVPVHSPEPASKFRSIDFLTSRDFSWMPSDFTVDSEGSVKLTSPYINNLHPVLHRPLYRAIEEILTAFLPLFERVLGDSNWDKRVAFSANERLEKIQCIWGREGKPDTPSGEDEDEFLATVEKVIPEAKDYTGQLEARFEPISLRGRTIQCIIKLANIHLTPEQPEYTGGSWHVEGMTNERIVASGIYYYDEENITESKLAFRANVEEPDYHEQDDDECMDLLYGMERECLLVQDIGAVVTKAGRALCWPNLFQHCVSPFKLADPSRPGHRKILAFFLVDPTEDRIVSATDVPPQQEDWAATAFEEACEASTSVLGDFPQELRDAVKDHFPETVMTLKEAEAYRLALMKERTASVAAYETRYVGTFNMCEH
ncbi:hypothetical protein K438DRAFT_2016443 [Mycena galopus ATCC 62051]|nr:hypothetical protein K438DRAFT_2016443 [Mycena galopus ATCC 62051]